MIEAKDSFDSGLTLHGHKCPAMPTGLPLGAAGRRAMVVGSALCILALSGCQAWENSTGGVGPGPAKAEASWYYFPWMAKAPYAPSFRVLDTESSLGPYARRAKTITLQDLIKMHGHPCDGLVTAACALSAGLAALYPDGVIDRTDTGCITNNSPCYGDVAAYLTGGRIRFGTQKIDPSLKNEFILHRFSTGATVKVSLKPGVFPAEVLALERKLRTGAFTLDEMRNCQQREWDYARHLLQRPLSESFAVETLKSFSWEPDPYPNRSGRGDVINKNVERSVVPEP
jgi:formylmethanofuran dehydrogenase subunit E